MKLRYVIGIIFLALQVGSIAYARFIPQRFFCWGPFDNHSRFQVSVTIEDKALTEEEIDKRYRYHSEGWEQRSMDNIFSYIQQYEDTYGKNDNAKVSVTYSSNGKPQETWTYQR